MRDDFHSVFTGGPGIRHPFARIVRERVLDDDGLPVSRARPVRRLEKGWREDWCRNYELVDRFLRARLGRPWGVVRAEIADAVRGTPSGGAVLKHADRIVAPWGIVDGRLAGPRGYRRHGFHVDAEGRLAELLPRGDRDSAVRRAHSRLLDPDAMPLGKGRAIERIGGVWYERRWTEAAPFASVGDRTHVAKRQLAKAEIDRLGLREWPDLVAAFRGSIRNRHFDRGLKTRMEKLAEAAARALAS